MPKKRSGCSTTRNGLAGIHKILTPLTRPALRSSETLLAQLILDWNTIMGEKYRHILQPFKTTVSKKTQDTTLHLLSYHDQAAFLLSYDHEIILNQITLFFGRPLIQKLRLVSGGSKKSPARKSKLTEEKKEVTLEEALAQLEESLPKNF